MKTAPYGLKMATVLIHFILPSKRNTTVLMLVVFAKEDQAVADQVVVDQMVEDQTVEDQTVEDQMAEDPMVVDQMDLVLMQTLIAQFWPL